jgi:hypothetical protein
VRLSRVVNLYSDNGGYNYAPNETEIAVFRDPGLIRAAVEGADAVTLNQDEYYLLRFNIGPETPAESGYDGEGNGAPPPDVPVGAYYPEEYREEYTLRMNPGNPTLEMLLAAVDGARGAE